MDNAQKEVHLLDYLNLMRKRKWLIIACVFITVSTVAIGNYTITPIYEARSQLVIDKEKGKSIVTGADLEYLDYESSLSEELTFNTQFKMITSYPVLERIINKLHLKERYEKEKNSETNQGLLSPFKETIRDNIERFKEFMKGLIPSGTESIKGSPNQPAKLSLTPEQKERLEMIALVNNVREKIKAERVLDTRMVDITVTDKDPIWAQDIANGIIDAYIEYDMSTRGSAAQKFVDWILGQINEMKQKLLESEEAFYEYKTRNKIFSLQDKQGINTRKIGELNASYIKVRIERMELMARIAELEKIMARRNQKPMGSYLSDDPQYSII